MAARDPLTPDQIILDWEARKIASFPVFPPMTQPTEQVALAVLEMGPDDVLLVKTPSPVDIPDMESFLSRLTVTLQQTFTSKVRNRVLVIPHDMDVTRVASPQLKVDIVKFDPAAKLPRKNNEIDAAYDLFACCAGPECAWIKPGERAAIGTGIGVAIPPGYYGRIAPRSGLALKSGIDVLGGVIDAGYRGEVQVILHNTSQGDESQSFKVAPGDRVAQLIIERCYDVELVEVTELPPSGRGALGMGSSGV